MVLARQPAQTIRDGGEIHSKSFEILNETSETDIFHQTLATMVPPILLIVTQSVRHSPFPFVG